MTIIRFPRKYLNDHKRYLKPDWKPNKITVGPAFNQPIRDMYRALRYGGMSTMRARNTIYTVLFQSVIYPPQLETRALWDGPEYGNR